MKKRILGTVLAATLIIAQAVSVFAAGSKTTGVEPAGDSVGYYETTAGSESTFSYLKDAGKESVFSMIMDLNNGSKTLADLANEQAPELKSELEGKEMVTPFFELNPINGGIKTEDGKYLVTLSVPALTSAMSDVKLLHYSTERSLWEIVTPTKVDYDAKTITAEFEDLSPVAVIAKVDASKAAGSTVGTSPKTGVPSTWMVFFGAAAVLAGVSAVSYKKAKH